MNLYGYVFGNPINGWDPYGLEFWAWNGTAGNATLGTLNFLAGVGDTISFGATGAITNGGSWLGMDFGGGLNDSIYGEGAGASNRCQQDCSGAYTGGQVVGYGIGGMAAGGKAIAKWGVNSVRFGKGSRLFGRARFGQQGILNKGAVRLGWGWNGLKEVFRASWAPRGGGNRWNHLDF
jgi:hypothetical protein